VNGPAAGAGMSYALSCDLRIMSDSAFFTTAFAKVGFSGDYGGSYFMTQLVGLSKAKELYFLSDKFLLKKLLNLVLLIGL
jgi:2-(1,2-epoxy-1,2-dihydrophenyl)acetyl-CoA isomerase